MHRAARALGAATITLVLAASAWAAHPAAQAASPSEVDDTSSHLATMVTLSHSSAGITDATATEMLSATGPTDSSAVLLPAAAMIVLAGAGLASVAGKRRRRAQLRGRKPDQYR